MSDQRFITQWRERYAEPTTGWEFGAFTGGVVSEEPPWSYDEVARQMLPGAASALDLGTGGGEHLLGLADVLPSDTHATEGWKPNVAVAGAALAARGIRVAAYDAARRGRLPYPDQRFDGVMSRHAAYSAAEVYRVLRCDGTFITQQVEAQNLADLAAVFGAGPAYPHITLPRLQREAEEAGLHIERAQQWIGTIRFVDVATLLSYLRMMPWQLPADFTVDGYAAELLALHHAGKPLVFTQVRFLLQARKHEERSTAGDVRRPR